MLFTFGFVYIDKKPTHGKSVIEETNDMEVNSEQAEKEIQIMEIADQVG